MCIVVRSAMWYHQGPPGVGGSRDSWCRGGAGDGRCRGLVMAGDRAEGRQVVVRWSGGRPAHRALY